MKKTDAEAVKAVVVKTWAAWIAVKETLLENSFHWLEEEKKPHRMKCREFTEAMKTLQRPGLYMIDGHGVECAGSYTNDVMKVRKRIEDNLEAEHLDEEYEVLKKQKTSGGEGWKEDVEKRNVEAVKAMHKFSAF